jgi:8-oxo-dGTP pyrophosphatase MutT (NUDIX family)
MHDSPHRKERSAGILVFRERPRQYLLLRKKKSLDFPKGKLERAESALQAAVRETQEETGLRVRPLPGFRRTVHYDFTRDKRPIDKTVTFFLARAPLPCRVRISSEHKGFAWLSAADAARQLRHANAKWLIREAERFLKRDSVT